MKQFYIVCLAFLLCNFTVSYTKKTGSNRMSSRQKDIFFPSADDVNELVGFSSFENGIILGSSSTEVSFDSFFPAQGSWILNGGTLKLKNNININTPVKLSPGVFEAEKDDPKTIDFSFDNMTYFVPAQGHEKILTMMDEVAVKSKRAISVGGSVNSVDWSYDDAYVAVAVESEIGINELQVYWLDDDVLTLTASIDFGSSDAQAVRWHPNKYVLASGKTSNNELQVYDFNPMVGLSAQSSSNLAGAVTALSWDPSGDHLAVGLQNLSAALLVFDVDSSGNLGSSVSYDFGSARSIQSNAIDFDSLGQSIIVGLAAHLTDPELYLLEFTGVALNEVVSLELGQSVSSVGWASNSQYFSIGLAGGTERLRTYRYDPGLSAIFEIETMRIGQSLTVNDLQWSPDDAYLAIGTDNNTSGHDLQVYFFDQANNFLSLVSGVEALTDVLSLRWSHDGNLLANGDVDGDLSIFNFAVADVVFSNMRLVFHSDVTFRNPTYFEGLCTINVGGNNLELMPTASLIVADNGILQLENATIKGIKDQNILTETDSGIIELKNIRWLQDEYFTFTQGRLNLSGKIQMSGDQVFAYQTSRTSTLQSNSLLKLDQGFTFSYDPLFTTTLDPGLIELIDSSSQIKIDNANLHDLRALKLTKGTLVVSRNVGWYGEQSSGTVFGSDGGDDFFVELLPGARFQLMQGILNSKNQALDAWMLQAHTSQLIVQSNARFNIFDSINVEPGFLVFERNARFGRTLAAQVLGATEPRGPYFQFVIGS